MSCATVDTQPVHCVYIHYYSFLKIKVNLGFFVS